VSLSQQLFCSFDGAAFLIRALGSPVQVCEDWGSVLGQSIVSPLGPLDISAAGLSICLRQHVTHERGFFFGTRELLEGQVRQSSRRIVMKGQRSTQARIARKLSGAIIARRYLDIIAWRYLDLQRLRDEVRRAETKLRTAKLEGALGSEETCQLNYSGRGIR
jgi:hypothetical protein